MKLLLEDGSPYPFPHQLTEDDQQLISVASCGVVLELSDVIAFEWLHAVTVEFASPEALQTAQQLTGWKTWSDAALEAPISVDNGEGHPAIVAGSFAYRGVVLYRDAP
jgi:hypothetical protein